MKNYPRDLSRLENEKYFEWITDNNDNNNNNNNNNNDDDDDDDDDDDRNNRFLQGMFRLLRFKDE